MVGQNRFRMKLHSEHRALPVLNRHDHTVVGLSGHLEVGRKMVRIDGQGMIPSHSHRRRAITKDPLAVVADRASHAVHRATAEHDTSKGDSNCLMSETDTQDGNVVREFTNDIDRAARLFRSFGPWRNHDRLRIEAPALSDIDAVTANHSRITIEPAEIASQVVDKRIVIIEQ